MTHISAYSPEIQTYRNFLRDLIAISSLPALWIHRTPMEIANGLTGMLLHALYLDLVYIRLEIASTEGHIEAAHLKSGRTGSQQAREIGKALESILNPDGVESPLTIENPVEGGLLQAAVIPIGTAGVHGYLIAGSRDLSFPEELKYQLLRVAVNQAAVILHQKHVEEQLRRKQEELSDFLENASEGLHWVGPDGKILWANQAELNMLGYSRDEYIGRHFADFHVDKFIADDLLYRLVNDRPVREYEARLRCKNGSIRHVLINSNVYRENGKFIHTRCFTRDITERKQMENALRKAFHEMEMSAEFRSKELSAAVDALGEEIAIRKRIELEIAELRGRLSESREAERLLLAQELHDGPIQELFVLYYQVTALTKNLSLPELKSVQDGLIQVVNTLRTMCEELRPSTLISFGLERAILFHIEQFKEQHPTFQFQIELASDGNMLPERTRLALYRIYQQALANIVRHAQADEIAICFRLEDHHAILEVRDNGCGFTVPANWIDFARQGHLGLIGGIERAQAVGGTLTIHSEPGKGTQIQARTPFKSEAAF